MGVSFGIDTSKLDICFGGFAPTVMGDMAATWERATESELRLAERKEALLLAERLEAARESELREWVDGSGTIWRYVLLDDADIRIKGCIPGSPELFIPDSINGHPVVEIAAEGCSSLRSVTAITVPDAVVSIGKCAFRGCVELVRAILPARVSEYRADWFRHCKKLAHLELPGALEVLSPRIFDQGSLKSLVIGVGARDVRPGAFINSDLEVIQVKDGNPCMRSDGRALYSKDWSIMAALAVPSESYDIHEGCRVLGKKAMSSMACLTQARMPDSLEVIGEFAFAGTSITSFDAPPCTRAILEKAFYGCRDLRSVLLGSGLEIIGQDAFTDTGLSELHVPATVRELEAPLAGGTSVRFSGEGATFSLEKGGTLSADAEGGLYEQEEDGLHFVRLLEENASSYAVRPGTVAVDEGAFQNLAHLVQVDLPAGVRHIGSGAFRGCRALREVSVQEGVESIGAEAFLDTVLEELHLPGSLHDLGERALVTQGAHHGKGGPSLKRIVMGKGNVRFRMEGGMLLESKGDGRERVVVYVGPDEVVRIPETVDEVASCAFNGATSIKELFFSDRIAIVGVRGLAVDAPLEHIHVDLMEPYEGHEHFDIWPPRTDRSEQQMMLALTVPTFVNVEALFEHYDNAIINGSSFDALSESGLDAYEQTIRLIDRLEDPVYMGEVSQSMARRVLITGLERSCLEMARRDDRASLRRLADLGILDATNIDAAIEAVQQTQDASMIGYLLELKRERFGRRSFDLSL